jgi:hypothetical protein
MTRGETVEDVLEDERVYFLKVHKMDLSTAPPEQVEQVKSLIKDAKATFTTTNHNTGTPGI